MTAFAAEEIILQYNVLGYRVDAYLPKHKLGIGIDEQGHNGRCIDYETEIQPKKFFIFLLKSVKCKITLLNRLKK